MKILDFGYLTLIEHWGSDENIVASARMSTQKGFKGWGSAIVKHVTPDKHGFIGTHFSGEQEYKPGDEKLLRYLWEHDHHSPFEFAGAVFEVRCPIFVAREWQRHRTFSFAEASARYGPLPDENYIPNTDRVRRGKQANGNKQGSEAGFSEEDAYVIEALIEASYCAAQSRYEYLLDIGLSRELARLVLPVGRYTTMRVQATLRNWLSFLRLREDKAAQEEIVVYAKAVHEELFNLFPRTLGLFEERQK